MITASTRYSRPMLVDQLEYLYQNLGKADQRPGQDAYTRYAELAAALEEQRRVADQSLGGSGAPGLSR